MAYYPSTTLNAGTAIVGKVGIDQTTPGTTNGVVLPLAVVGSHTQNSTLSSAQTITMSAGTTKLLIQAFTQNVRYTLDGTTPTASKGFRLTAGNDPTMIPVITGQTIKLIEETTSASIEYQLGN